MKNLSSNKFWLITSILLFGYFLINLIIYEGAVLSTLYYLEPAENEQLVFAEKYISDYNATFTEYLGHGVLPIYPNVYFDVAKIVSFISENTLQNLRLLNIIMHSMMLILFGAFTFKQSRSIPLALMLPTMLYGTSEHLIYFLMARPDGMYFFFGFSSVLLYISLTASFRSSISYYIPVAFLLTFSILTKQSGIYFFVIVTALIIIEIISFKKLNLPSLIIPALVPILVTINFKLLPYSWDSFNIGLEIYATDFSYENIKDQIFGGYRYAPLGIGCLLIIATSGYDNRCRQISSILLLIITIVFSVKLFSNIAAFSNNYILLTSCACLIVATKYRQSSYKKVILLLIASNFLLAHTQLDKLKFEPRIYKFTKKINAIGELKDSEIFAHIKENPGIYLTGRNDNYLIYTDSEVIYEGSVFDYIFQDGYQNVSITEQVPISNVKEKISIMINDKKFAGVLVGIGQWTLKNYPDIAEHYTKKITQLIDVGNHPHEIQLWVPNT